MPKQRSPRRRVRQPKGAKWQSLSKDAQHLLHHLIDVKKYTYRKAARLLGLPNFGQVQQMYRGLIRETDAMKAAVLRRQKRARRAFLGEHEPTVDTIDADAVKALVEQQASTIEQLKALLPKGEK